MKIAIPFPQVLGAMMYGLYLQQTAFLGHDAGHSCIFHNRFLDSMYGVMVGNVMTGISMAWWKDSHNVHHRCVCARVSVRE